MLYYKVRYAGRGKAEDEWVREDQVRKTIIYHFTIVNRCLCTGTRSVSTSASSTDYVNFGISGELGHLGESGLEAQIREVA